MKVLITGAGGFIGTHLYNHLNLTHDITRIFSSTKPTVKRDSYSVNLTRSNEVKNLIQVLSKTKYNAVIHLASKTASPGKIEDLAILKENIEIVSNVVSLAQIFKPEIFINFSSMAVYPQVSGLFSEDNLPKPQKNPDCLYGLSKYCSEVMIDFLLRNENTRIVHLRISQVYGKGLRSDRIIPVMLKDLKENNTITVYGNGERISNFINVGKLVKEIEFILQEDITGIYNVGDQNISYLELAQELINQYGDQNSTIKKEPHGIKEKFILDVSKLESLHKA